MDDDIYTRYKRIWNNDIQLLLKTKHKDKWYFLINGSTSTNYKVCINMNKISCTCPDYTLSKKLCKHCLFVLCKVLKVFNSPKHEFYKRLQFTPDEIHLITKQLNTI